MLLFEKYLCHNVFNCSQDAAKPVASHARPGAGSSGAAIKKTSTNGARRPSEDAASHTASHSTTKSHVLSSAKGKFTFSGAPHTNMAKKYERSDYSHSQYEVMKITADNNKLCKKLLEISSGPRSNQFSNPPLQGANGKPAPAYTSPAAVNRRKKEDLIAQENLALYKRLQAVKPSKEIRREALAKDFEAQQAYGVNARKYRPAVAAPAQQKP